MAWVSFWADVASEMVYPVLPLFLVGTLKAPASILGLIEGFSGVLLNLVRGWSGAWSDRTGLRVPFVRTGYGLTCLSKPLLALAMTWPFVATLRLMDRFGKGLRNTSRDALLADSVDASLAGRAFGFHRAMDAAGALVGSLLGFMLLVGFPSQYRLIFGITAIPALVAFCLTFLLRESGQAKKSQRNIATHAQPLSPSFYRILTVSSVFALANSSDTFILLRAKDAGLSEPMVVLAYALFNLVYSVSSYPFGRLSDRFPRVRIVATGWIVYALVYVGLASAGAGAVWPLMALYGLYNGATDGTSKAWVRDFSEASNRGTAMGLYAMVTGTASFVGSVAAGLLWDLVGHAAPFWLGAGLALLAVALLPLAPKSEST